MTFLLQTYEEEFKGAANLVESELDALQQSCIRSSSYAPPPSSGPQSRTQRCAAVGRQVADLREMIMNMDYESREAPTSQRQTLKLRLEEYERRLNKLHSTLSEVKAACLQADRADLLEVHADPTIPRRETEEDIDVAHKRIMVENTEKFKTASNTLLKAEGVLYKTEAVGAEALQGLQKQTEQLHEIREMTAAVDDEITESRSILQGIHRGMVKQKAVLILIIGLLIGLIVVATYVWVRKHTRNTYHPPNSPTVEPPPPW